MGAGGGGGHKGREGEDEEEETAAVDDAKIVALLDTFFVVWCFCPPPRLIAPSAQKGKESWHSPLVWRSRANDRTQHNPPMLSPVRGSFLDVGMCTLGYQEICPDCM